MTATETTILDALARLLEYPGQEHRQRVVEAIAAVDQQHPAAADCLRSFARQTERLSPQERQELFCRTFDINPVCCLEVGWHIHGDNYDRGDFLVRMRRDLRRFGIEESSELPDHLTHVLRLLGRLEPQKAVDIAERYARPAVAKMLNGIAGRDNPYEHVLRAVALVIGSSS